jgi:hypothetical protein
LGRRISGCGVALGSREDHLDNDHGYFEQAMSVAGGEQPRTPAVHLLRVSLWGSLPAATWRGKRRRLLGDEVDARDLPNAMKNSTQLRSGRFPFSSCFGHVFFPVGCGPLVLAGLHLLQVCFLLDCVGYGCSFSHIVWVIFPAAIHGLILHSRTDLRCSRQFPGTW